MRHTVQTRKRFLAPISVAVATALALPLSLPAQASEPTPPRNVIQGQAPDTRDVDKPADVPAKDRAELLGKGYKKSTDTAFTTSGDGTGFHLLVADQNNGYAWKTAATLSEPGFDTDTWIGNACLTASGKRAAVAYAPRTFTNKPELMARGAFTALVDLTTGTVTKLPFQASLAYFSPGCGDGEQAVFTQLSYEGDAKQQTRLVTVDAVTGKASTPATYPGQVTSAVPTRSGIIAANGNRLVAAQARGRLREITRAESVPFQLTVDAMGGVTYIDRTKSTSTKKASTSYAKRLTAGQIAKRDAQAATVATGKLTDWDLTSSADGTVYITGRATSKGTLPMTVKNPGGITKSALVSSHGSAAVTTAWADGKDTRIRAEEALTERTARISLRLLDANKTVTLDAVPGKDRIGGAKAERQGAATSPALPQPAKTPASQDGASDRGGMSTQTARTQLAAASPSDPSEDAAERTCAVARNDVKKQAFQPTPRQVEWAVDQAVVGKLDFYRSANWKNTGMGGYQPQGLFPPILLEGDPNGKLDTEDGDNDRWHIPSQILLGVTAQESNMWQASRVAVPGVTSNSLIGNYYGVDYSASGEQQDPWAIDWSEADCGYGITQATDGMRLAGKEKPGETAMSTPKQEAVALDYTANIAYGAQILSDKWNQTRKAGMKVNDGHPKWIENWFFALWAYNSGFYDTADSAGHWGVGWTNNPANPLWKANRLPFLENASGGDNYADAAHPQDWPYEEKVIGWAARPIAALFGPGDIRAGYVYAWWNDNAYRTTAKPPIDLFCDASNSCDESKIGDNDSNDPGLGACTLDSGNSGSNPHWLHCWWNKSVEWKNCTTYAQCGNQVHRFNTTYPEQPDANSYPPRCSSGLASNALIVDDVPNGTTPAGSGARSCGASQSDGSFTLNYSMWNGTYPGKIDTHQIGAGYGNHFYFAHTRQPESTMGTANRMRAIGVWKLGQKIPDGGQARVYAHIPDHGAQTTQATYEIKTAFGTRTKTISQDANQSNKWVDLGFYRFNDTVPEVSLSNFTSDGTGDKDIAWDAIAFVPGDYETMPDVVFGAADPNAPDIDILAAQTARPADPPTSGLTASGLAKSGQQPAGSDAGPTNCATGNDGTELCATYLSLDEVDTATTDPTALRQSRTLAAAAAGPVGWCKDASGTSYQYTRIEGCLKGAIALQATRDGAPIGSATMKVVQEIKLDTKSQQFTTWTELSLISMTGISSTSLASMTEDCWPTTACTESTGSWIGSLTWTTGDTHTATRTNTHSWNKVAGGESKLDLDWTTTWTTPNAVIPANQKWAADSFDIRCDNKVGGNTGCVFYKATPTLPLNKHKYPAAAAYYWVLMEMLNSHPGSEEHKSPLHRLADDATAKDNRDKMCELAVAEWKPNPKAIGTSCDEYPFAKSRESGGMKLTSGKFCAQMYAVQNSDGTYTLKLDENYDYPTWHELCGRAAITAPQNTAAGGDLGRFTSEVRLLDNDAYYVQTGLEGCDIDSVCDLG
ncbi:golvesin C-terminal-like domain-containing protein [Streptomyces sp. 4N124]|uniref:golvesin C-terminal-like domain-containing protein n=1 Tax=Streptomyces sp. 4N124 TaxID=3457420 RepID=UPI003FD2AE38